MSTPKKLLILAGLWLVLMLVGFILGGFNGWLGILGAFLFIMLGAFLAIDAFKTKRARIIYVVCFVILFTCLVFLLALSLLQGDPYLL